MPAFRSQNPQRKLKPPACDSCKARRVLCHPTTDGTPCPRCAEKDRTCTTTPVVRGRPPTNSKHLDAHVATRRAVSDGLEPPSDSHSSSNYQSEPSSPMPHHEPPQVLELSPELVRHLFECFKYLPQYSHPMYRGADLLLALSSCSWKIQMLPTQLKVLAHCVMALAASVSFHQVILGPGPQPVSFTDRSVFMRDADLRTYGVRRAPMFHPSEDNATSCYLIHFLENSSDTQNHTAFTESRSSRPWAVSYLSHVRAIAASWDETHEQEYPTALWTGFLLLESLEATLERKPILVSHNDQLLITGIQPLSLQNLFTSIQHTLRTPKKSSREDILFATLRPFLFHITRLARQLSETITGDFARRHALNEPTVAELVSELTLLHSICTLVFDSGELDPYPTDPTFYKSPQTRDTHMNVRSCAHIMTFGRATLVLALYRELARRASIPPSSADPTGQWAAERLDLLYRQTREMANFALEAVARGLRFLPSIPHLSHLERTGLIAWAQFALDEADALGVTTERATVLQTISGALKLVGYSWPLPPGLVERLDSYADAHLAPPPLFAADSLFMNMFPSPQLDNDWMTMFTTQLGDVAVSGEPEFR
ncbi:hypothetical protein B0H19DRAFT_1158724 [Mycena capillaripes]|nr:hypothetical protein B0H19DRAFT_1158724 [Mycena capillaripes]